MAPSFFSLSALHFFSDFDRKNSFSIVYVCVCIYDVTVSRRANESQRITGNSEQNTDATIHFQFAIKLCDICMCACHHYVWYNLLYDILCALECSVYVKFPWAVCVFLLSFIGSISAGIFAFSQAIFFYFFLAFSSPNLYTQQQKYRQILTVFFQCLYSYAHLFDCSSSCAYHTIHNTHSLARIRIYKFACWLRKSAFIKWI